MPSEVWYTSQCFRQTAPLRESRVAFGEDPQKNGERANLALYFHKAACRFILIAIPRLKIASDVVANEQTIYKATNISFLATKNSGLVAIITTSFLYVEDQ